MKKALLTLAMMSLGLGAGIAAASEKHRYVSAPVYQAPYVAHDGHAHRPYYAPPAHRHGHRHGYWRNGRWIAPVVVGATVGAIAIAASSPSYSAPVTYYAPPADRFAAADLNNDGYLSYYEARRYGGLHRNFAAIDYNGDGYLSRQEVHAWRYGW